MDGDSIWCCLYGGFLDVGVDQRIFGMSTAAPREIQKVSSS